MTKPFNTKNEAEEICLLLFCELVPSFITLPHVLFRPHSEIAQAIVNVTSTEAGPWPAEPVFDSHGEYVLGDEPPLPFSEWANDFNKEELARRFCGGGDFANNSRVVVNCMIAESVLERLLPQDVLDRDESSEFICDIVEPLQWAATPVSPDFTSLLFVCDMPHKEWCSELRKWATREGIDTTVIRPAGETIEFDGFLNDYLNVDRSDWHRRVQAVIEGREKQIE